MKATSGLHCLVTGATGYIGGRLVPELLDAGHRVRCLARSPEKLRDHPWAGRTEIVRGDVTDAASVAEALRGIDVAYYLVHALAGRIRLRGTRPCGRPHLRRASPCGRGPPHRLPRRAHPGRDPGPRPVPAPALPRRGRRDPARLRGADHRPARRRHHRLRLGLLRNAALPDRTAPRHGHPQLGRHPRPARRRPRRPALPRRQCRHAARGQPRLRHRRPRRAHVRGDDAPLRRRRRPAPPAHPARPDADPAAVQPLDRPRHAGAAGPGPAARRVPAPRGRVRGARHRAVRTGSARRPDRRRPGRVPGPAQGAGGGRDHALVLRLAARCTQRPAADRPRLGGRQPLHRPARTRRRRLARRAVAGGGGHRRGERLVLVPAGLGRTGMARPARRRGRHPARPARRGPAAGGGLPGLLAGGRDRTGPPAAAARGDAAAGAGLAGDVRGPGPGYGAVPPADRARGARYRQRALFHPHGLLGHLYWWSVSPFHAVVFGGMARNIARAARRLDDEAAATGAAATRGTASDRPASDRPASEGPASSEVPEDSRPPGPDAERENP